MGALDNKTLMEAIKDKLEENKKAIHDIQALTKKIEQVNKKLKESEQVKSNFLSNIRNEMNNPLSSILGLSRRLASKETYSAEDVKLLSGMIFTEAFNLDCQLRNIMTAAEIEAGEAEPSISKVEIPELVKSSIESYSHRAEAKGVKVSVAANIPSGRKGVFKTDAEKLQIAIANLLSNAIEYSREGGRVEIRISMEAERLKIEVVDYGIGISEADKAVIFDRFRQIDTGVAKSHPGHGLGLSISKSIVEMLGGDLSVKSVRGEGSTFTLSIPEAMAGEEVTVLSEDGNVYVFEDETEF